MPTEAKDIFEATSRSVKELMSENGLGMYIPAYQRPYGWDKTKVTKLLDDTLHGLNMLTRTEDSFTFLGSIITIHDVKYMTVQPIVRDEVPARVLTVIDGQQRLCSLLMLCVALHNQTAVKHWKLFKGKPPESDDALMWINGQTLNMLKDLAATFYETQAYGDSPIYPRIIRAFTDQWSRKSTQARYQSPIANLVFQYVTSIPGDLTIRPVEYRPVARTGAGGESEAGESDLIRRYSELRKELLELMKSEDNDEVEPIPRLDTLAHNQVFQKALLNHEFPPPVVAAMASPPSPDFAELLKLLLLSGYVLNRIALTVVRGKNEDYAFTIFESLNTTGEPLTAFETFKPRVVSAEGLEAYGDSTSRIYMDEIDAYLAQFNVGNSLQTATRDLLVSFALAETGEKLSKRLADQRIYLKNEFERYSKNPFDRMEFLKYLRDCASLVDRAWDVKAGAVPELPGLPSNSTSDTTKMCLSFLRSLNHSIAIGPLVRFYSAAREAHAAELQVNVKAFEGAIKAITAFSVLWRASKRTTANIDREYREIMAGIGNTAIAGPLARRYQVASRDGFPAPPDVDKLRQELRSRLAQPLRGSVANKADWVQSASALPVYQINRVLTRMLLLAAYHDTVPDIDGSGLIVAGKSSCSPCLTFTGWRDDGHLSLEHVAPQLDTGAWNPDIYANKETVHKLGNLVLVQNIMNSSLNSRPWDEKRVLYAALGAPSHEQAMNILVAAAKRGTTFAQSTETIASASQHMPQLVALGERATEWSEEFISTRSERLLDLAWDRLWPWLN